MILVGYAIAGSISRIYRHDASPVPIRPQELTVIAG
jgi:hypothetical protein